MGISISVEKLMRTIVMNMAVSLMIFLACSLDAEAYPVVSSVSPNPAVVVTGGRGVVMKVNGTGLNQITRCVVIRNMSPVARVTAILGPVATSSRSLTLRATTGAVTGNAQLRVFSGTVFFDVPLTKLRISILSSAATTAVKGPRLPTTTTSTATRIKAPSTTSTAAATAVKSPLRPALSTRTLNVIQTRTFACPTRTPANYTAQNTAEFLNTAASPTYQNYKPSLKIATKWNGPWYAPGEYVYITITLDSAHCDEGYIVTKLIAFVAGYIPWAGAIIKYQFDQTAKEIVSKNKGYGVKIVLKLPIIAVGVPLATNTVTSAPPTPPGPVWNEILGMTVHAWSRNISSMSEMPWGKNDMGQGPYALSWLVGDVDKDFKAEIIQPWKNGDLLGMIVYGWDGRWMVAKWGTDNMGTAPGAYSWLVGDIDKDGKPEIIQPWKNDTNSSWTKLGMNVYGWDSCRMKKKWATDDMGWAVPTGGAPVWLVGDVDGDGKAEILMPAKNGKSPTERLDIFVYGWGGSKMVIKGIASIFIPIQTIDSTLSWLVGDIDKDGKAETIQPWANGDKLGMNVYGWDGSKMVLKWRTDNMGTAPGALSWLVGDVDADGKPEIIQPWANGSQLAMNVYGWDGSKMVLKYSSKGTVYQGSVQSVAWLVGDVDKDGKAEIIQRVGPTLGKMCWKHYGLVGTGSIARMAIKPGTGIQWGFAVESNLSWLVGDINGDGMADIIQPWTHALLE